MRLTCLQVLAFFILQCNGSKGNFKTIIGLYCPNKTDWHWDVSITPSNPLASRHGHATNSFQYIQMELDNLNDTKLVYSINQNCTNDERSYKLLLEFPFLQDEIIYGFIAVDLLTRLDTNAYEQLFSQYLKNECPTGDCSPILNRINCSYHSTFGTIDSCKRGLEKAVSMLSTSTIHPLNINDSSTTTPISTTPISSNNSTFIIFGAAIGAVLIIAVFVACFFCEKKSSMDPSEVPDKTKPMEGSEKSAKTTRTRESQKIEDTGSKSN